MADGTIECINDTHGDGYALYHGDCIDVMAQMPDHCIDLAVFSPPFGDLFVHSDSECDMGNSSGKDDFFAHYGFAAEELRRVIKPGRICAVHCSDLPTRKWKDGIVALTPFSDHIREAHERAGFIFYRRVTIWKCPVVEQGRTHARNLGYSLMLNDSAMSAPGLPDYLMIFRVPGENEVPITHTKENFPLEQWQEWASPVWMTINQTNVLGGWNSTKTGGDEKHICPLQLDVIERAVVMWSNPGEVVLSPFAGIGSEGVVSTKLQRKFVGIELKGTYFDQAERNLSSIENQPTLF